MLDDRALRAEKRRFESDIVSVLQSFEKAREWADLTGCLNRLHKAIDRPPRSINYIPCQDDVSRRLGQCLNQTLPSGVHAKCLEVYSIIFERIQTDGLGENLGLWSSGLVPLFHNAATHIKPLILGIIDQFYIPLKHRLLPCLTGLLVCILPGLEDPSADCYNMTSHTLERIANDCVGQKRFMIALWTVLLRTPRVRLPALCLLKNKLVDTTLTESDEDQLEVFLPYRDTLILRALEKLFGDSSVLVKREVLDFLILHLPLNSHILTCKQKVRCLRASFQIIAFLEWSLTRRFLHWITGQSDILDVVDLCYFRTQVRDEFCSAICEEFDEVSSSPTLLTKQKVLFPLKVLRIILAEIEELSSLLLQRLAVPVLDFTSRVSKQFPNWKASLIEETRCVLAANETGTAIVWTSLEQLFEDKLASLDPWKIIVPCRLSLEFLDDVLVASAASNTTAKQEGLKSSSVSTRLQPGQRDETTTTNGFKYTDTAQETNNTSPSQTYKEALIRLLTMALRSLEAVGVNLQSIQLLKAIIPFAIDCLSRLTSTGFSDEPPPEMNRAIESFFVLFERFIRELISTKEITNTQNTVVPTFDDYFLECYEMLSSLLIHLLLMIRGRSSSSEEALQSVLKANIEDAGVPPWCEALADCASQDDVLLDIGCSVIHTFLIVIGIRNSYCKYYAYGDQKQTFKHIALRLWSAFDSSEDIEKSSVAGLILELHNCHLSQLDSDQSQSLSNQLRWHSNESQDWTSSMYNISGRSFRSKHSVVLDVLVSALSHHSHETRTAGFRKFNIIWKYSHLRFPEKQVFPEAMRLVLDCLDAAEPSLRHLCRSWLSNACRYHLPHVVDPLFEALLPSDSKRTPGLRRFYTQLYDVPRVLYILSRLTALLHSESHHFVSAAENYIVSEALLLQNSFHSVVAASVVNRFDINDSASLASDSSETDKEGRSPDDEGNVGSRRQSASCDLVKAWSESDGGLGKASPDFRQADKAPVGIEKWGYGDDRCVVNYLDLSCIVASRFIQSETLKEFASEFDDLNLAARSAAIEFLRILLETAQASPTLNTQRCREIHLLLGPPMLSVFAEATTSRDSIVQTQILDVLKLIVPIIARTVSPANQPVNKGTATNSTALQISDTLSSTQPTEGIQTLIQAKFCKANQIKNVAGSVSIFINLIPSLLLGLDTLGKYRNPSYIVSPPKTSDSNFDATSTLGRLVDFSLFVVSHIHPQHPEYIPILEAIIRQMCILVVSSASTPGQYASSATILCLLNGLKSIVLYLLQESPVSVEKPDHPLSCGIPEDIDLSLVNKEESQGGWFPFFGIRSSITISEKPSSTSNKSPSFTVRRRILKDFIPLLLAGMISVLCAAAKKPSSLHNALPARSASKNLYPESLSPSKRNSAEALQAAPLRARSSSAGINLETSFKSIPLSYIEASGDWSIICATIEATLYLLFSHCIDDFVLACLLLRRDSDLPWGNDLHFILCILLEKDSTAIGSFISSAANHLLSSLKTATPTPLPRTSIESLSSANDNEKYELYLTRLLAAIKLGFFPHEAFILEFAYFVLSQSHNFRIEIDVLWSYIFDLIDVVLNNSRQPFSFLWCLAILQELDLRQPSRESCFSQNAKRNKRNVTELSKNVAAIAAKQFHLRYSSGAAFDLSTPPPPISSHVLRQLQQGAAEQFSKCRKLSQVPDTSRICLLIPIASSTNAWRARSHSREAFREMEKTTDVLFQMTVLEEDNPIEILCQYGVTAILDFCHQLNETQRRTAIAAAALQVFTEEIPRIILPVILRTASLENLQLRYLAVSLVQQLPTSLFPFVVAVSKRLVQDFISSPAFGGTASNNLFAKTSTTTGAELFKGFDRRTFRSFSAITKLIFTEDADGNLFSIVLAPHSSAVFSSREFDILQRACELKRLSFIVLSCQIDTFKAHLSILVERIVENLRLSDHPACDELHTQAFLFLRVLLLRFSPVSLASIWPVILTELIKAFSSAPPLNSSISSVNLRMLLSILKVVDLAVLLDVQDFHLHQWMFISDFPVVEANEYEPQSETQESGGNQHLNNGDKSDIWNEHPSSSREEKSNTKTFNPICERLAESHDDFIPKLRKKDTNLDSHHYGGKRRPIINVRNVENAEELSRLANQLNCRGLLDSIECTGIDDEAVQVSIENDLLDVELPLLDWGLPLYA